MVAYQVIKLVHPSTAMLIKDSSEFQMVQYIVKQTDPYAAGFSAVWAN